VRVLVTGARGFVGSHLVPALASAGHEAIPTTRADGDLLEEGVIGRLLDEHQPDATVHLAGLIGWIAAERDPGEAIRENTAMTALVARACRDRGVRLAQGSTENVKAPAGVYALSKRWAEEAARHYCPDVLLLRLSGPYGPGVLPGAGRGAIVNMLDQARRREPVVVHRGVTRSWCWIGDVVDAIVRLVETGSAGGVDVGSNDVVSLRETGVLACETAGASAELVEEVEPPTPPVPAATLDLRPLTALGWAPQVPLPEGMRATFAWLEEAAP
jgi:nucleoside-diphosphate-sugar epimerase